MALSAGGSILMLIFPPFYGIDTTSDGQIHAFIGHHALWSPPTPEHVFAILSEAEVGPEGGLENSNLEVRRNNVRLGSNIFVLILLSLLGLLMLKTGRNAKGKKGERVN